MGTTARGLRYPEPTDLVTNGATAIQALAQDTDDEFTALLASLSGAEVLTDQSTSSTAYTDLATVGPAVTVTIGSSGRALVYVFARAYNSTNNEVSHLAVAVSGATTAGADDQHSASIRSPTFGGLSGGGVWRLFTGLTPGSTTFTAKYRVGVGTSNYAARRLIVLPL